MRTEPVTRRLALIVNPAASGGRGLKVGETAAAELRRRGAEFELTTSRDADHARAEAGRAAAGGEVVVAVGGDGFVGLVASAVRGDAPLAIVPAGRGNDFARVLGIPRDAAAAVAVALTGTERRLDLATVNGRPFVGIASFGLDSDANRIANDARLVRGNLVYFYAGLRALWGWRPASFDVVIDGERESFRGYAVAVANSKAYGGGMYLVPHAELDDGVLDVMLTYDEPKLRYLRSWPKVFSGSHVDHPVLRWRRGRRIELSADRPFTIYADGDPIAELPATVEVEPGALRVIVP